MTERGEQVIEVPASELRKLCRLPDEVDILGVLPSPTPQHAPEWYSSARESLIYVKIRSQFAFISPPNSILMIEPLEGFLERYRELRKRPGLLRQLLDSARLTSKPSQSGKEVPPITGSSQLPASQSGNG
jgi:hypothetical protein